MSILDNTLIFLISPLLYLISNSTSSDGLIPFSNFVTVNNSDPFKFKIFSINIH